jgi:DNA-binding NarL/FixJ family response regulator
MNQKAVDGRTHERKRVYLIGSESLFHETLSVCIAQELGAETISIDDPRKAGDDADDQQPGSSIFLINGSEMNYETVIGDLQLSSGLSERGRIIALFNIPPNSGIEKRAFENGVRGFFYSSDKLAHFLRGLDTLLHGGFWVSREVLADFALRGRKKKGSRARERTLLTEREAHIIALVSIGATNGEIARKLNVSQHTVKTHLYNIFKKISVPNRFQAALWAAKNL